MKYVLSVFFSVTLLTPVIVVAATTAPSVPVMTSLEQDAKVLTSILNASTASTLNARSLLRTASQTKQLVQLAKLRRSTMQMLATQDPVAFLRNAMSPTTRTSLPAAVQEEVENAVTLTGRVKVKYIDDLINHENSKFVYTLRSGSTDLALQVAGQAPTILSNATVRVNGYQLGQTIVTKESSDGFTVLSSEDPETVGEQLVLAILVTSEGYATPPSPEYMRSFIFSGDTQKFYQEASYGKTWFTGDVTDWISIAPYRRPARYVKGMYVIDTDMDLQLPAVQDYLIAHKIDLLKYDRIVFIVNDVIGGYSLVGKHDEIFNDKTYRFSTSVVGWNKRFDVARSYERISGNQHTLGHELGHALGVVHANSWECWSLSLDSNCVHDEAGNFFDIMGYFQLALHFNAYYKDVFGWLDSSSQVSLTNGTYSLAPLEAASGIRAGVWNDPRGLYGPLYIEFRQPIGYDGKLDPSKAGLQINQNAGGGARLIDANYATSLCTGKDCPSKTWSLMPGSTFSWGSLGITIRNVRASENGAVFDFEYKEPTCTHGDIVVSDILGVPQVPANPGGRLTVNVTNNDTVGCRPLELALSASIPGSTQWSVQLPRGEKVPLGAGDTAKITIDLKPTTPSALLGNATVQIIIQDPLNNRSYAVNRMFTVIAPPIITSITPTSGEAGSTVILRGTDFNEAPNTNTLLMWDDNGHRATIRSLSATNGTITFVIPKVIDGRLDATPVPTPPGQYSVSVTRDTDLGSVISPISYTVAVDQTRNISGKVTYGSITGVGISDVLVIANDPLRQSQGTRTNANGDYVFSNLSQPTSHYSLQLSKEPPIDDRTRVYLLFTTDLISSLVTLIRYMTNPNIGTPEQREACDLHYPNSTNPIDINDFIALLKFMNTKTPFPRGIGWIFTPQAQTINGNTTVQDYTAILRGDCAGTLYR